MINSLREGFARAFSDASAPRFFYAPGRVNLIGEHIDYNGGCVFPCALSLGTYAAVARREDGIIRLASENFEPAVTVSAAAAYDVAHAWANYPKAVVSGLRDAGLAVGGFDMYVMGNLPSGAGLSSSASLLVLTFTALNSVFELGVDVIEGVKLCQMAENEYIGVNCGIMDQFASAMGRKNHAILLNCATLEHEFVPLELGEYCLVISNSNKRRELADSKYNERRGECEKALAQLQKVYDIKTLCDMGNDSFADRDDFVNGNIFLANCELGHVEVKRAVHVISEQIRTMQAATTLKHGNLREFGRLMYESHYSLRDKYEVSGAELDALVEAAANHFGPVLVPGSRMTGAGFGGCTISLVHQRAVQLFTDFVGAEYTAKTGLTADFYVAQTDDGARELK